MKTKSHPKDEPFKDMGFGTKIYGNQARLLNPNGSFNVRKSGLPFLRSMNFYHILLTMPWLKFILLVILFYLGVNLLFACIYVVVGLEFLVGITGDTAFERFGDAFFFSAQTLTTVGYGRISPVGFMASLVAAIESLMGLMTFAIATGILYGKFSRPIAKIIYSEKGLIAPFQGNQAFMFRIANARRNELIELEAQVTFSMINKTSNVRQFYRLDLERDTINFLTLNWTLVHPIKEDSPLYGLSQEDFKKGEAEFIILFKAFDDTFSQTVYSRYSYRHDELVWGAKFKPMYGASKEGINYLQLDKIGDFEAIAL